MANFIVSRLGADQGDTGTYAKDTKLFLKVFSGEVLTSFAETNVFLDKHYVRTITHGKSAQFPVMGKTSAAYHTPGVELTGGTIKHTERVITIDDLLVAQKSIANIDEAMNHYDVREKYSYEMGAALARQMDQHIAQVAVRTARDTANIAGAEGHGDGLVIPTDYAGAPSSADFATNGSHLTEAFYVAAEKLAEKDIPVEECFIFVRPAEFYRLVQNKDLLNKDWGGRGSYADADLPVIAGMRVVMTNNLPKTNITTGTAAGPDQGNGPKYAGDFTKTSALVMHPSAVGTLKLMDLAMEMEYSVRHQATFMVAKYAVGHDGLRPEGLVEIANDTKANLVANQSITASVILD
ncbi:capsid protein [Pyruvatibacter mobilis]|uniref:Capsid protein n=1 Tax=Pyruvatibacter mobilis TaxID=1712261 RepID=A0A845Q898_9HYPH|nr:phage capsid protein [Pyruvatibacter mobilis]NBG94498.1 capsid protein [Pyruvatibacter mobilis]QJD74018.1 capsid protein [Pyruvatibacter mobilis]GGD03426.1 phage capsid protein [Pyruvatibacter mobilis]